MKYYVHSRPAILALHISNVSHVIPCLFYDDLSTTDGTHRGELWLLGAPANAL